MPDKLRLEDVEEWVERWDALGFYAPRQAALRALIALLRAAKREVRCTCTASQDDGYRPCAACSLCPDTAAELERWE